MSHSVFRFFQLLCLWSLTSSKVQWVRITDPVIFGDDVTLFCRLPNNFEMSFPRQWKNETMVLTYDEGPSDISKYEGSLKEDGFTLTIKQFAEGDFRRNYTCSYRFEEYKANLTTENYRWNPQPGTYIVDELNSTVESVIVDVQFQKVYPEPNCTSLIGQKSIQIVPVSSHMVDRYFLAINLTLEHHYDDFDCGEKVFILCKLGNNSETIIAENISTPRQCGDICQRFSPCLNNGTCKANENSIECECSDGFNGKRCENSDGTTNQVLSTTSTDVVTDSDTSSTIIIIVTLVLLFLCGTAAIIIKRNLSKEETPNEKTNENRMNGISSKERTPMMKKGSSSKPEDEQIV